MIPDFNKDARMGSEFVHRLAVRLGDEENTARASRILRSVLRVLRNHLTFDESLHLMAQLPMILKGLYVDGWLITEHNRLIRTIDDLVSEVISEEGSYSSRDFSTREEAVDAVKIVWETLADYVSDKELDHILAVLPPAVRKELKGWLREEESSMSIKQIRAL
jgi:uncharacterized protein (DUF2267 family)